MSDHLPRRAPKRLRAFGAVAGLALLGLAPVHAERADRTRPINIEADAMQYDDARQTNVFQGNVTLTKGSIVLKADRITLRQDAQGFTSATATGSPATFRQRRDAPEQSISAVARQVDYDGRTETVRLTQQANLKRLDRDRVMDEIHGHVIVYDSRTEFFTVESGGATSATPENPSGRVRVTIQPRATDAAPAVPGAPATLKPANP